MNDLGLHGHTNLHDPGSGAERAPTAAYRFGDPTPLMLATHIAKGSVTLDPDALRALRHARMLSQQDLADECWRRNIRVSIATIKRAECGQAVRFRIARELARCFEVPVHSLVHPLNA